MDNMNMDNNKKPSDYIGTKNKIEDVVKLEKVESAFVENEFDLIDKCEFKIEIEETNMKKECFGENDERFSEYKNELVTSYLKVESNVEGQYQSMLHNEENNGTELKQKEEYPSQINEIQSEGSGSSTQNQLFVKKEPISNIKTHNCNVCNKSFTFKSLLDRHLRIHTGERPFTCTICEFSFKRKSQLTSHMLIHNDKKPYVCDICQKYFNQKAKLVNHKLIHNGIKFSCDECNKSFLYKQNLVNHKRIHSRDFTKSDFIEHTIAENIYSCDMCGRVFTEKGNVIVHKRSHTGERPYSCTVCDKKFAAKSNLMKHTRIHIGEKPYSCDVCGKAFTEKGNLTVHKRSHTGETPYSCTVCNKSFARIQNFNFHKSKYKH